MTQSGSIDQRGGWARAGKGDELLGWRLMSYGLNLDADGDGSFLISAMSKTT